MDYEEWDPKEALTRLAQETDLIDNGDSGATAKRIITNAAPGAALAITHLALNESDPRIRFQAAKYILDTTINVSGAIADTPIEEFLKSIVSQEG